MANEQGGGGMQISGSANQSGGGNNGPVIVAGHTEGNAEPSSGGSSEPNIFSDIFAEEMGLESNQQAEPIEKPATAPVQNQQPNQNQQQATTTTTTDTTAPVITEPAPETPEQIAARTAQQAEFARNYEAYLDQQYAIPDEVKVHFTPEQTTAYQQGMKHVHKTVKAEILQQLIQIVPQVFQQQYQQMQTGSQIEQKFKSEFGKINLQDKQHAATFRTVATIVNQMNPNISPEQRAKAIGTMVYAQLGLANDAAAPPQTQSNNQQFPSVRSMGGGNVSTPTQQQGENIFGDIFDNLKDAGY